MKFLKSIFFFLLTIQLSFAQSYQDEISAHREQYKKDFLEEERSPLKKEDIQYLRFFDADEKYRMTALFKETEKPVPFDMATMNGKTKKYIEYGTLSFTIQNQKCTLRIFQNVTLLENPEYKDHLFLPFNDLTNGDESYINGRYLDFKTGDIQNGKLILDFNKAYNPYCAFSDGYSCPKPPLENNLAIKINAGEKTFGRQTH
jgi:uncharacterized protein (DUF1684 family)